MKPEFDHVAILVSDITAALNALPANSWEIGEVESFPSEGTKEVYIGPPSATGKLLLIQPNGDGPYQTALAKRGPGLHHIAVNVESALEFTEQLAGSGWYLHPTSLNSFKRYKTVWLARPGVPLLVEVVQRKSKRKAKPAEFIGRIEVPFPKDKLLLIDAIGIDQLQPALEPSVFITIDDDRKQLTDLIKLGT